MPRLPTLPKAALLLLTAGSFAWALAAQAQQAQNANCPVTHDELAKALKESVKASGGPDNGGMPTNNQWGAVVNRDGVICAIAFSGNKPTDQWLASHAIAAEKAYTVVSLSSNDFAQSTANMWAQAQPGGDSFGAALSNPPVASDLYAGKVSQYGGNSDPLLGKRVGGIIVFGGGLALYKNKELVGGLGTSGNTSCADHNISWRVREKLGMNQVPNGPTADHNDAIVYDVVNGKSQSGFGHPTCGHHAPDIANQIGAGITLSQVQEPTGPHAVENGAQPAPPPGQKSMTGTATPSKSQNQ